MATITIPDFNFSSFYYADILEALLQYKRVNVPELTDENEFEPSIQLLRAFALVGHLNNVLIDVVANESTLTTAKLVETVRSMLRLIDYELSPATPARVEILLKLSRTFPSAFEVTPDAAQVSTKRQGDVPVRYYEISDAIEVLPTTSFTALISYDSAGDSYVDEDLSAFPITPWPTPAAGDALYFAHASVMFNAFAVTIDTAATLISGIWEYRDNGDSLGAPDGVSDLGGSLELDLSTIYGASTRAGTFVTVTHNDSGVSEEVALTWNGSYNVATTGLLGQSSPSVTASDYTIDAEWKELSGVSDGTNGLTASGDVKYDLPQTTKKNWVASAIGGDGPYYAIRFRIIEATLGATSPVVGAIDVTTGDHYVIGDATQGQTNVESPLGSSTGLENQSFETSKDNFISGSEVVTVEGEVWEGQRDFLSSGPASKHYVVVLGENDRATITFGDGKSGKIPPLGVGNVAVEYRHNAVDDGNVGPGAISVDKTGLTYVSSITNPRQANGWAEAEGSTEESLETAKTAGPASLRTKDVAIGPSDVENLAVAYTDENGSTPYSRAYAIEEGFGPKTIELVVVANGGGAASVSQLEELSLYFNGDKYASPPIEKHIVANQEVTAVNYQQKAIDIVATVYGNVEPEEVKNKLAVVIRPEATRDDGEYEWAMDSTEVPTSRIVHEIFATSDEITKVVLSTPATDVALATRELPVIGDVTITVIKPG